MSNAWKNAGFTQRKPKAPGVYFLKTNLHMPRDPPRRLREGWDVVEVRFDVAGFGSPADAREDMGHWRLKTLAGLDRAWHSGMWLKGLISPFEPETPTPSQSEAAHSAAHH